MHQSDVTILGGGLAGLTLALQLRQELPTAEITVLEKRKHPVPEAAHKVGESTVEVAAHYFGEMLGLRQHIIDDQLPKLGLRFFFPAGDNSRIENRLELGGKRYAPCPSYQLDRGRFENHLGDLCLDRGISFIDQANVTDIRVSRFGRHQVVYKLDGEAQQISTRWVIDASGRRSFLKRQLGLAKESSHIANAAWFRFNKHLKIDDWCDDPVWQQGHNGKSGRWYSTNHFMGQGYWVWLIPLASGSTSMGIVAAERFHSLSDFNSMEKALSWLQDHEPQCAVYAGQHLDDLQDFKAIKHYSTECRQVFSASRWGITGEAGFFHDPFYSPGSDFIAFSNTFLTDLISRDMKGRGFRARAYAHDRIFKRFYYGTKTAYQDQYVLFGNPTVMPVKILWDYLIYWSITAFVFMQGRMCHQTMYVRNLSRLSRLAEINHQMQGFFRSWHESTDTHDVEGVIDISQIPLIRESNQRLLNEMSSTTFYRQFEDNVCQIETLAAEIVSHAGIEQPVRLRKSTINVRTDAFERVFKPARRQRECGSFSHSSHDPNSI